jgi:hypothetical protein
MGSDPDHPAPADPPVIVELDPGLAFGTGHHPTTALCLRWLDQAPLAGRTLIDYGCGSGILAIAATTRRASPWRSAGGATSGCASRDGCHRQAEHTAHVSRAASLT